MRFRIFVAGLLCAASAHAEFSGRIRFEDDQFLEPQPGNVQDTELSTRLQFEYRRVLTESWRFRLEPNARLSSAPRLTDSFDGDFRDTYIEKKTEWAHLQAGSFVKIWEGPDGVNPMDIASVTNYRDPFANERIGSVGLAANGSWGAHLSWDAIYVPWQTPARMPGNNSPWWPRRPSQSLSMQGTQLFFPDSAEYDVQPHDQRGSALKDNWGARVQAHLEGLDLSLAYFVGAAQLPVVQGRIAGTFIRFPDIIQLSNPVTVHAIDYRRRTAAAGVVWNAQSWIFRLAARYDQPFDGDTVLPGWSDQFVGAVERTAAIGGQTVIFSLGLTYEDGARQNESPVFNTDPFRRAVLAGARVPFSDDLVFFVSGLYDAYKTSSYAHLNLERKLGSNWSIDGSFDYIRGPDDSLMGIWKHESRLFLAGQYQF
jgi:hypothetical protein